MKNKLIILLCFVIFAMAAFASCTPGGEQAGETKPGSNNTSGECKHPVSAEWSTNETHHWHATTCEHGEFRTEYAEHSDADEDGLCDSCEYEVGHEHTYTTKWLSDVNNHWKAATCTHTNEISGFALHFDENSDGKCDACYAHVHVVGASGKCDICDTQVKPVDTSDLSDVILAITGGYSKVTGGKITTAFTGRYGNSAHSTKTAKIIEYLIGNNSSYYKIASAAEVKGTDKEGNYYEANTSDIIEKWNNLEENGKVFGVYRETINGVTGEFSVDAGANEDTLYGYYSSVSTLADGYGAEGILVALYEQSQKETASNFVVIHEEGTNTYKFSFDATFINSQNISGDGGAGLGIHTNVNYFETEVEFTYDENYSLTYLNIVCDCYTSDAGSKPVENPETGEVENKLDEANVDIIYDAATGKFTLKPGALADTYTITIEQTTGERTFVNEYTKEYFAPKGFLVYADLECTTLCPETVTVSLSGDRYARFYLQDSDGQKFATATAEALEWTTSDESGLSANWPIVGTAFSFKESSVRFLAKTAGTYTVSFTYQGVTKTFTVIVTA